MVTAATGDRTRHVERPPPDPEVHLLHEGDPLMTSSVDKIAGAPISWGVCEVPGWGYQLPPARVLTEMAQVGLAATEFGPDGFLPADPAVMAEFLATRHLTAVGGFTPVVLHEAGHDPAPEIERLLDGYDAAGAEVLVLSAATGPPAWPTRAASAPSCTRTSAPWSRAATRSSGCSRARPSRSAWTPATCSSAVPTRPS